MKTVRLTCLAVMVCAASSLGGEIFGTISEGSKESSKAVGVGAIVHIKPTTAAKPYDAKTDESGRYHVYVAEIGKCTVVVDWKDQKNIGSLEIESYETPVRFDLAIEKADGTYSLRRR